MPNPHAETPAGIPASFLEHVQLMYDLLFLAFQTDSTRIATFLLAYESSNRTFPDIGITDGHHNLSHHQGKKANLEKIAQIDLWYMQQFARFLDRLDEAKDVDGNSILHNSMIVYGSGNGDGNRHNHNNLPFILAGTRRRQPVTRQVSQAQGPADEQPLPGHARPIGHPRTSTATATRPGDSRGSDRWTGACPIPHFRASRASASEGFTISPRRR